MRGGSIAGHLDHDSVCLPVRSELCLGERSESHAGEGDPKVGASGPWDPSVDPRGWDSRSDPVGH